MYPNVIEGSINENINIGTRPMPTKFISDIPVENINGELYVKMDNVKGIFIENQYMKDIIYNAATYKDERDYIKITNLNRQISIRTIVKNIESLSLVTFNPRHYNIATSFPIQALYRIVYSIMTSIHGYELWEDKPKNISRLKWLWQTDKLYYMFNTIRALSAISDKLIKADKDRYFEILDKLSKQVSKNIP